MLRGVLNMWNNDIIQALQELSYCAFKCTIQKIENNLIYFSNDTIYSIPLHKFVKGEIKNAT